MNFRQPVLILLSVLSFQRLLAQTQPLQLKDAIASACENNKQVILANNDEQIATAKYKQTDAIFLPKIGVSYTAFTTNNPLNVFGFKLQQQSIAQGDFQPDLLYQRKAAKMQIEISGLQTQFTKDFIKWRTQNEFMQLQLSDKLKNIHLPKGYQLNINNTHEPKNTDNYTLKWDGEWQIIYEVFRDIGIAFGAVIILIYILTVGWAQ